MATGGSRGGPSLEYTPTWVAAMVCAVIISFSLGVEKILHLLRKRLKGRNKRLLYKALQKVKEELLLLGFISLVLARLQDEIVSICIPMNLAVKGLPCKVNGVSDTSSSAIAHFSVSPSRHLLAEEIIHESHCHKGKVPLISYKALHDLHILIFVLAVVHIVVCASTVLFGAAKILLIVGTKLAQVITLLAMEVVRRQSGGEEDHKEAMENAGAGFNSGKVRAITRSESAVVPST